MRWKFWQKQPIIEFYCHPSLEGVIPEPKSAVKNLPEWFKHLPTNLPLEFGRDEYGNPKMTAKKCLPLLDAMSYGYTIPLCGDVRIMTNHDCSKIEFKEGKSFPVVSFHDVRQIGERSAPGFPANPIKFLNHWIIKTAPGWSTLFLPPINHLNEHFTCLAGIVDTDKYPKEVNFPAIWHTKNFDGSLAAGTPLVTAIPIKRDTFDKKPYIRKMSDKEMAQIDKMQKIQGSRSHYYTHELREKK